MHEHASRRHTEIHRQIAEALAGLVPNDPTIPPHPYLRRHLAEHAAEGQVLDDEHVPPSLLAWESSFEVRRLLAVNDDRSERRHWLQAWATLEPFARQTDPLSRLTSLQLAHAATLPTPSWSQRAMQPHALDTSPVTPLWSDCATPVPAWSAIQKEVTSLAAVQGGDGMPTTIAAGDSTGTLRILRRDGRLVHAPVNVHTGAVNQLMALPGGLVLTAGADGCVVAVDTIHGKITHRVVACRPQTWVSSLTSYTHGHLPLVLAAFSDGHITAVDPGRFQSHSIPLPDLQDTTAIICGVRLPGGHARLLFTHHDKVLCFDGRTATVHSQHAARIRAMQAMPQAGQYVLADEAGNVFLYDLTAAAPATPTATARHTAPVTALLVTSFEGRPAVVSASGDGTLRLWRTPSLQRVNGALQAHTAPVTAMTRVADGSHDRLFTAGADRIVRSWRVERSAFKQSPSAWNHITASALSPLPPYRLAAARASRVVVWDLASNQQRTLLKGRRATALAWPRVRQRLLLAAALSDNQIVCVEPDTGQQIGPVMTGHFLRIGALVALSSARGDLLASASADGRLCLWDVTTGQLLAEFPDHKFSLRCLATHHGARGVLLASGGSDGNVRVWDPDRLTQYSKTITCDQDIINDLAFVEDDDRLLLASAGQDGTLKLWNADTAEPVGGLTVNDGELGAVTALSLPLGRAALAVAGRTSIHLWDATADRTLLHIVTGSPIRTLKAVQSPEDAASSILLASGEAGTMAFRLHHERL